MSCILDDTHILDFLSQKEKEEFSLFCQERYVNAWETLFHEWDEADSMYILKSGSMSIDKLVDRKKVNIWVVHAEEILWEMALFEGTWARMATAVAREDSILITFLSFSIKDLTDKNPKLFSKIKYIIEQRLVNNKITINSKIKEG